jgi:hypothetical protein
MRYVNFRLEDDDYKLLQDNLPCSVPSYCKSVATGFIEEIKSETQNVNSKTNKKFLSIDLRDDYLTEKFTFLFTTEQKQALAEAAKSHGWNLSREVRHRLQMTLDNKMDFFDQELRVLNGARNAVDVVGRNLNFIIVRDNAQIVDKSGFKEDVDRLQHNIASLKAELESYIALCKGRRIYPVCRKAPSFRAGI